jgi:hypothetical protein
VGVARDGAVTARSHSVGAILPVAAAHAVDPTSNAVSMGAVTAVRRALRLRSSVLARMTSRVPETSALDGSQVFRAAAMSLFIGS